MAEQRRTALISGSGRNIGRAVALALAADGCNVVVNGSNDREACEAVATEVSELGVEPLVVMGDVGIANIAKGIAEAAIERFGTVDVLVNNAAIRPSCGFLDMEEDEWHRVLAVDLQAAFWLSRACLPGMLKKGWGRIVNFAGMNAIHGYSGRAHVSVAKHGAWGLTKSLAKEFGSQGITTNIVSPGPTRGERDDSLMTAHIENMRSRVPAGRLGEAEEVAAMIALLASEAGAFVNGQLLQINGGAET